MKKEKKIKVAIISLFAVTLTILIIIMCNKQNLHEPYSHDEIVNILNPPLDESKPINQALFDKYYYTPKLYDMAIILKKKMAEVMSFETYGDLEAFVFTHPNDSLLPKFQRPIYVVEQSDREAFTKAVTNEDTLLFKQSGKIAWTFYKSKG